MSSWPTKFVVRKSDLFRWTSDFPHDFHLTSMYLGMKHHNLLMYEINVPWRSIQVVPWRDVTQETATTTAIFEGRDPTMIEMCLDFRDDHLAIFGLLVYLIRSLGMAEHIYYRCILDLIIFQTKISSHPLYESRLISLIVKDMLVAVPTTSS